MFSSGVKPYILVLTTFNIIFLVAISLINESILKFFLNSINISNLNNLDILKILLFLCSLAVSFFVIISAYYLSHQNRKDLEILKENIKTDKYSGLNSISYFEEALNSHITTPNRNDLALFIVKLEKNVVNTYSTDTYQLELSTLNVAKRLVSSVEKSVYLSRIGPTDFVGAFTYTTALEITRYLSSIRNIVNHCSTENKIGLSYSIGLIEYSKDQAQSAPFSLLTQAYRAVYRKERTLIEDIYILDIKAEQWRKNNQELSMELYEAVKNNQLELYFQPQVDIENNTVIGLEALVRWQHPKRGFLTPDKFIHLIDSHDIALVYARWLLTESIKQLENLAKTEILLTFSLNISPFQLQQSGFIEMVNQVLREYPNTPLELLVFEITESNKMKDKESVINIMHECHDIGIKFSLDDFGTGFSSLDQLRTLPVDEIKIDRCFIQNVTFKNSDQNMVKGLCHLAEIFDIDVVAEGVESKEHVEILRSFGCKKVQGYFYSKPLPSENLQQWIKEFAQVL